MHLSGGEPGARRDLVDIAAHAREAGLRTNLITSGVGIATRTVRDLWEAGLHCVQVSFQDADAVSADHIAGHRSAFQRKLALATEAVRIGLPLTVSMVVHRASIERIGATVELALRLKANRVEFVPVQYRGWAVTNRMALMPTAGQIERAADEISRLQHSLKDRIAIDAFALGDSGDTAERGSMSVTPSGRVLPSETAEFISGVEFWNVREHSLADIWEKSPAFKRFRDTKASLLPVSR